jgi:hypothetical protein
LLVGDSRAAPEPPADRVEFWQNAKLLAICKQRLACSSRCRLAKEPPALESSPAPDHGIRAAKGNVIRSPPEVAFGLQAHPQIGLFAIHRLTVALRQAIGGVDSVRARLKLRLDSH